MNNSCILKFFSRGHASINAVERSGINQLFAFCIALAFVLGNAGYCYAVEAEGEVVAIYKNLILIKNIEGREEAIIARSGANPRRREYIRFDHRESIAGIKIAETVALKEGAAIFDPSRGIRSSDLNALMASKKDFILIDLRSTAEYNAWHLPSALSMPADAMSTDGVVDRLKGKKESTVIFHCRNSRDAAASVYAEQAYRAGYPDVMVYLGGAEGWIADGFHVVASLGHIAENLKRRKPMVFIDTRSPERVSEGHIPGAINITPGEMRDEYIMPFEAADQAVFYGEDDADGSASWNAAIAAAWGYSMRSRAPVMILEGGFKAWEKGGMDVEKGSVPRAVTKKPSLTFGTIFYEEFKRIWSVTSGDKILLDVRSKAEADKAKLHHTVNIPVEDIPFRVGELPKNKEIIVFCSVGTRARIAHAILAANGFKVRYLGRAIGIDHQGRLQ